MPKTSHIRILLSILLIALLASCNMPSKTKEGEEEQSPEQLQTFVAQTVTAHAVQSEQDAAPSDTPSPDTEAPPQPSETPTTEPTNTPIPTDAPTVTNTPIPCNQAKFVEDVTIPDGTDFNPGDTFVKTWRLRNTGSCSWTSGYDIVFSSGDAMSAPSAVQLTANVIPPGGTVDVSVNLTAPADPGTYRGNWKLRDQADQVFGIQSTGEFWVEIDVIAPTNTPTATNTVAPKADLVISFIELNPTTHTVGNPVDVKVQVYNQGNAAAGAFTVAWYARYTDLAPAKIWDVPSSNAGGGRVLTFTYTYLGDGSFETAAIADFGSTIDESDEGNNTTIMNFTVNP